MYMGISTIATANHSFKYFGKEQGVSVYTFRDERDLLWHSLVFSQSTRNPAGGEGGPEALRDPSIETDC
jgi:hypothetical protein